MDPPGRVVLVFNELEAKYSALDLKGNACGCEIARQFPAARRNLNMELPLTLSHITLIILI